jgi:hypothetical protein
MKYCRNQNLTAIKSDGTIATPAASGLLTLSSGTWYLELGSTDAPMCEEIIDLSVHLKWSALLAGPITFEWTNFPATLGNQSGQGAADVTSIDATAGNWVQDNEATGDKVSAVVGAANTVTNLTITAGGTTAGAVGIQLKDRSARRYRLKAVLSVGGTLRAVAHGKLGA